MKNRPVKHKSENAFAFKRFSDRISEIDIRRAVLYHVDCGTEYEPTEDESYFQLALQKWKLLNQTVEFDEFYKEVRDIVTLPQVLLKKEFIFEHLFVCLQTATKLSLQPLLDFFAVLANELQEYFMEWLPRVLDQLVRLLQDKDAEVVEWTLTCLAYLFKHLKRHLKKDFGLVLDLVRPILGEQRQPEHVQNFAVECFSYVARDIRDRDAFFGTIVKLCADNDSVVKCCGQLLFQIVHGVSGQFHSCAEPFFGALFDQFVQRPRPEVEVLQAINEHAIEAMLSEVSAKAMPLYWQLLMHRLETALQSSADSLASHFTIFLGMALQIVNFRRGHFVVDHPRLVKLLLAALKRAHGDSNGERQLVELTVALLNGKTAQLSQLESTNLIRAVVQSTEYFANFEYFVVNSTSNSQFDQMIFTCLLEELNGGGRFQLNAQSLELLAQVLTHRMPVYRTGVEYLNFRPAVDFAKYPQINRYLVDKLQSFRGDLECCLALVVCRYNKSAGSASNDRSMNAKLLKIATDKLWPQCVASDDDDDDVGGDGGVAGGLNRQPFSIFSLIIEYLIQCGQLLEGTATTVVQLIGRILPWCKSYSSVEALRLLDLLLTHMHRDHRDHLNLELFRTVHETLAGNLGSAYHEIRLLSSHSLSLFAHLPALQNANDLFLYELMHRVEATEPSIETYRGQLQLLQKLTYDSQYYQNLKGAANSDAPDLHVDPLHYLFGVLHVNFKLIWQPTLDIITSYYGQHMQEADHFWSIYKPRLNAQEMEERRGAGEEEGGGCGFDSPTLNAIFSIELAARHRPDFVNYRKHIWSLLPNFRATLLVRKSRELVQMFFDFYERQYKPHIEKISNVRKNLLLPVAAVNNEEELDDDEDEDADAEGEGVSESVLTAVGDERKKQKADNQLRNKSFNSQLMNYLSTFQNFPNPKNVSRSKDLHAVYVDLLAHKHPGIQQLALTCLLAYRDKTLDLYKDNLTRLIDEKRFRDTLNAFSVEPTATAIAHEHRAAVMTVLTRIMYGKMYTRLVGGGGAKRNAVQSRKMLVIRYLSGCTDDELLVFITLCFRPLAQFLDASQSLDERIRLAINIDLRDTYHGKYLQSALTLLQTMMEQFGQRGDTIMRPLFQLLLTILAIVQTTTTMAQAAASAAASSSSNETAVAGLSLLRSVRREVTNLLKSYFDQYDNYAFEATEIETVFRYMVWPSLDRLPQESAQSPTILFKLIQTWTKSPRYFILLAKYRPRMNDDQDEESNEDRQMTPLSQVMALLAPNGSSVKVANIILDMVHSLLTMDVVEGGEEDKTGALPCKLENILPLTEAQQEFEGRVNLGSLLLMRHLDVIVDRLKVKLGRRSAKSNKEVGKRDLTILNRITELVQEQQKCNDLVGLLLPILTDRTKAVTVTTSEGALVQMISALIGLFRKADSPQKHIRTIAPLFETVTVVRARQLIVELFGTFADPVTNALIADMNALSKRWIDQPDHERRLDAFKVIDTLLEEGKVDINLGLIILYHILHYIRYDKDLAMRNTSSYCLKKIVVYLAEKYQNSPAERQYLFDKVILNIIKRGIVGPIESVRSECIGILGDLSRRFPNVHFVFADLHALTNATDLEVDFFANMVHAQTHRQARAMQKFVTLSKEEAGEGAKMSAKTLIDFVYPMAALYLGNEKFVHNNALIDTAIECIAAVCKWLPFYQYQTILRVFVQKLRSSVEHQKQMIKAVVAIIEQFHFDFSAHEEKLCHPIANRKKAAVKGNANAKVKGAPVKKPIAQLKPAIVAEQKKKDEKAKDEDEAEDGDEEEDEEEDEDGLDSDSEDIADKETAEVKRETKRLLKTEEKHSNSDYVLMVSLVQSLNNSVHEMSARESSHKMNKKDQGKFEEEEILRVPIALATVQLLQKVSKKLLDQNLPKIFLKMCSFLKSRLKSVRIITRDMLREIMMRLGPKYLPLLLDLLSSMLRRGFQVHVLVVTLHSILEGMRPQLTVDAAMDENLSRIMGVCIEDIFGTAAEEKEVAQIGSKTPEAKTSNKSYVILSIMASTITERCLLDVVVPFKEQLARTNSAKVVNKVQTCFTKLTNGLMDNRRISAKSCLSFIYGILTENIDTLKFVMASDRKSAAESAANEDALKGIGRTQPDIYLIDEQQTATKRREVLIRQSALTNAHVLNEFALNLLHSVLRGGERLLNAATFAAFVNPIVPHLHELIMSSHHVRVITLSVKCISSIWIRQIPMEELLKGERQRQIVDGLFGILKKYAGQDLSMNNENYQLIKASFKAIMSLIACVDNYQVSTDQLKALLFYVDQDLHNKQAIAFPLLRTIISKKLIVHEIHATMDTVSKLAITADSEQVREEAREILMVFFLQYPLGEKFAGHMKFFNSQLDYELPAGRESAVKMLRVIINKIPKNVLQKSAAVTFVLLGARMVNDDVPAIRRLVYKCVEELLKRSDKKQREDLFNKTMHLLRDKKPSHIEMAALLCNRFVTVEEQDFSKRLSELVPVLVSKITNSDPERAGRFVRGIGNDDLASGTVVAADDDDPSSGWLTKAKDHQLIQLLILMGELMERFAGDTLNHKRYVSDLDDLSYTCQNLLAHEHAWVRYYAAKIIFQVLQSIDLKLLRQRWNSAVPTETGTDDRSYLYNSPRSEIKSLVLDLCAQLRPDGVSVDMAEEVMRNLLVIAMLLNDVQRSTGDDDDDNDDDENGVEEEGATTTESKPLTLLWLIRRLNYAANSEVIHTPHAIVLRTAIFNWMEGVLSLLDAATTLELAPFLLAVVMRELSPDNNNTHTELKRAANRITTKTKKLIGEMELTEVLNRLQQRQEEKRSKRRTKTILEKIHNPEKAAKRRVSQQQSKKMAKKRKMGIMKGKVASRKRKFKETNEDEQ